MLRQKIFCTFLWFTLPTLVLISLVAFFVSHMIRHQDKVETLERFSSVMSTLVNKEGINVLEPLQDHDNGFRITVIAQYGQVLFDSERDPAALENHLQREEVIEAQRKGKGASHRYSDTLEQQTYYQAQLLDDKSILRISFITETLLTYTLRMTAYFIGLLLFIVIACSFIARRLAKYLMDPFNRIDLNQPLKFDTYDELLPFLSRILEQQNKIDEQIAELNRKSNELQVIIKSMSDGLVLLNAQGNILTINKIARKIFGVTKEDCINQNYTTIDQLQYMQELMSGQNHKPRQTIQITREDRDYEIRFNRIEDNNICLGFAMIVLDVTDKVRSEQMRQEFTANVSHELKTPLQSIIGYSELMSNGLVRADDIKPFAERIHRQSTRLQSLIEDIIFLSSLDEGQAGLTEPISVTQITREIFDNLMEKANENNISLKIEGNDLTFVAVNRYIYELIYNLVDNAIRYNKPNGSVTVTLKESTNKYQIEVKDTGIGVSQADQFRIFERFYRVDKSHSRKTGGTGLGLSIVKRVVMFHHGKIKIQSTLDVGTTFTVTFNKDKLVQVVAESQQKQQQMLEEIKKNAQTSEDGVTIGAQNELNDGAQNELNDGAQDEPTDSSQEGFESLNNSTQEPSSKLALDESLKVDEQKSDESDSTAYKYFLSSSQAELMIKLQEISAAQSQQESNALAQKAVMSSSSLTQAQNSSDNLASLADEDNASELSQDKRNDFASNDFENEHQASDVQATQDGLVDTASTESIKALANDSSLPNTDASLNNTNAQLQSTNGETVSSSANLDSSLQLTSKDAKDKLVHVDFGKLKSSDEESKLSVKEPKSNAEDLKSNGEEPNLQAETLASTTNEQEQTDNKALAKESTTTRKRTTRKESTKAKAGSATAPKTNNDNGGVGKSAPKVQKATKNSRTKGASSKSEPDVLVVSQPKAKTPSARKAKDQNSLSMGDKAKGRTRRKAEKEVASNSDS